MRLQVARRDDKEKVTSGSIELLEGRYIHAHAPKRKTRPGDFPRRRRCSNRSVFSGYPTKQAIAQDLQKISLKLGSRTTSNLVLSNWGSNLKLDRLRHSD
jgi:hypothetical protein